jgi:hypothetical protein
MSEIVHITFEKLTGLKGTIEGEFIVSRPVKSGVVVYKGFNCRTKKFYFSGGMTILCARKEDTADYSEHFSGAVNLLIAKYGRGGGVKINSQSPN